MSRSQAVAVRPPLCAWTGPSRNAGLMAVDVVYRTPGQMTVAELASLERLARDLGKVLDRAQASWSEVWLAFDRDGALVGARVKGSDGAETFMSEAAHAGGVRARLCEDLRT